ncbi:MAG: hypothetical protein P8181_14940 [bacterium]
MTLEDIKKVMDAHAGALMSIPGVVGVAIGALDDGTPCIQILVVEATGELKKRLPGSLDGHPVVIEVTGTIRGMPDPAEDA